MSKVSNSKLCVTVAFARRDCRTTGCHPGRVFQNHRQQDVVENLKGVHVLLLLDTSKTYVKPL